MAGVIPTPMITLETINMAVFCAAVSIQYQNPNYTKIPDLRITAPQIMIRHPSCVQRRRPNLSATNGTNGTEAIAFGKSVNIRHS